MEKKISQFKLFERVISMIVLILVFTFLPNVLSFAIKGYKELRFSTADLNNIVHVNEFALTEVDPSGEIEFIWDRCVDDYIVADKNLELIMVAEDEDAIVGKTVTENIDFNQGCMRLRIDIPKDEWKFLSPIKSGQYQLLMQLNLQFENGVKRPHLIKSDPFIVE